MTERCTMSEDELPWPKIGEKLINISNDAMMRMLSHDVSTRATLIAEAYKRVADSNVDAVAGEPTHDAFLMFPVVYLYRHYVELQMKCIIFDGRGLRGERGPMESGHDLLVLWESAKRELVAAWPDGDAETLHAAEIWIRELHAIDPKSTAFRYATDLSGKPTLTEVDAIDLEQLRAVMNRLGTFLESALAGMAAMHDYLAEESAYH